MNFVHIDHDDDIKIKPIDLDETISFVRGTVSANSYTPTPIYYIKFRCKDSYEPRWEFQTKEKRDYYFRKLLEYSNSADLSKITKL